MQPKIDISIVIVNYNVKDFLLQCINSIQKSVTDCSYEIIIIDNKSTDGSKQIFEKLSDSVDNLHYYYLNENLGFGKANNIGFDKSNGKYTLILNPDTIIEKDTLQVMFDFMESNNNVGISGCKVLNYDGTFQSACRRGFPTPWASFCKLFGLQRLFPKSKIFAKYNLSYLDENEQNDIDALIGAFMFARTDLLKKINGFDESFFMYGEDLDLCYRIKEAGYRVTYYPKTTITHFKGESSKRSTLNETKHFYEAMEIFAKKHYGKSKLFFSFLKIGIKLRSAISYIKKFKRDFAFLAIDMIIINLSLMLSTKIRWGEFFAFPDYAYPNVFIYLSLITFISLLFSGEYFEGRPSIRKTFFGLLASFLILTFLTYFFRDYAFSRGILLMTISFSVIFFTISRIIYNSIEKKRNKRAENRILFVGWNEQANELAQKINVANNSSTIIGYVNNGDLCLPNVNYIGEPHYLQKTVNEHSITEIIVLDSDEFQLDNETKFIRLKNNSLVHIYKAKNYDDLISAKIITELSGINTEIKSSKLLQLRYKIFKRLTDIAISIIMLTIGLPFAILNGNTDKFVKLLKGKLTFVGIYPISEDIPIVGKFGIIGLAHISEPENLTKEIIEDLNSYYIDYYSLSLDFDILFKYLFRR